MSAQIQREQSKRRSFNMGAGGVMLISMLLGLSSCLGRDNKYKITASVRVRDEVHVASSIQRFSCHKGASWAGGSDISQCFRGQSVAVDLGNGRYLFLLVKGPRGDMSSMAEAILRARGQDPFDSGNPDVPMKWLLKPSEMPLMVTFADISDPSSIKLVDPNNLSSTFGASVSLNGVEVEETSDGIFDVNLGKIIPWIKTKKRFSYLRRDASRYLYNVQYFDFDTRS